MDWYNINRLIKGNIKLEKGVQCKKEIKIIENNIVDSTLDIWCRKQIYHPELIQYEVYKCFIIKYELAYAGFFNPNVDWYHYTLKDIAYTDKIDEFPRDMSESSVEYLGRKGMDAKQFFENSMILDKYSSSEFIGQVKYENGEWHFREHKVIENDKKKL